MGGEAIPDEYLDRFIGPLLQRWNRLDEAALGRLQDEALPTDPAALVSFVTSERTPYGYEYVEFEIRRGAAVRFTVRVEGRPGTLSTATHHPVVLVTGDPGATRDWLAALATLAEGAARV